MTSKKFILRDFTFFPIRIPKRLRMNETSPITRDLNKMSPLIIESAIPITRASILVAIERVIIVLRLNFDGFLHEGEFDSFIIFIPTASNKKNAIQ